MLSIEESQIRQYLADDQDTILCLMNSPLIYDLLPKELVHSQHFTMELLKKSPMMLALVDGQWRSDRDMVKIAVERKGRCFGFADLELQKDRTFVLACLKKKPTAYVWLSDELKMDAEVALTAMKCPNISCRTGGVKDHSLKIFSAIPKALTHDRAFAKSLLEFKPDFITHLSDSLKADKDIIEFAMEKSIVVSLSDEIGRACLPPLRHLLECVPVALKEDINLEDYLKNYLAKRKRLTLLEENAEEKNK